MSGSRWAARLAQLQQCQPRQGAAISLAVRWPLKALHLYHKSLIDSSHWRCSMSCKLQDRRIAAVELHHNSSYYSHTSMLQASLCITQPSPCGHCLCMYGNVPDWLWQKDVRGHEGPADRLGSVPAALGPSGASHTHQTRQQCLCGSKRVWALDSCAAADSVSGLPAKVSMR